MSKSKATQTIDTLLADRARFEAWLTQLAAKAGHVPDHVVSRVRDDYATRLEQVITELSSRADELQAECEGFEKRIAELDSTLGEKRDARAEDELRALVGEYDEEHWAGKRAAHDEAISMLESERDERLAELTRVRDMLAQATRPSRAMAAVEDIVIPDEPTPVPVEALAPDPAPAEPAGALTLDVLVNDAPPAPAPEMAAEQPPALDHVPPAPIEPPKEKKPSPFDEIAFLKTVVGRSTPLNVPRTPAEPNGLIRPEEPPSAPPKRTTDARPVRTSIPTFEPPPLDGSLTAPAPSAPPEPTTAEATPESVSSFRISAGGEGARSLKCQECGAMNFPTEWYCEKCGGELAAF